MGQPRRLTPAVQADRIHHLLDAAEIEL